MVRTGWPDRVPCATIAACHDIEVWPPAAACAARTGVAAGDRAGRTRWLRSALITFCGLVALFTPLALWVAWSQWMFWLIIACGCGALVIIYLVLVYSPDEFF